MKQDHCHKGILATCKNDTSTKEKPVVMLPCIKLAALPILLCFAACPGAGGFVQLANDYKNKGVQLVGISSNSVEVKPMDGPAEMAADAKEQGQCEKFGTCVLPFIWCHVKHKVLPSSGCMRIRRQPRGMPHLHPALRHFLLSS